MPKFELPPKMGDAAIIRECSRLFSPDGDPLRQRVKEFIAADSMYQKLGITIRKSTGQPVYWVRGLSDETIGRIDDPHYNLADKSSNLVGDISYFYSMILTEGVKRSGQYLENVALRFGGIVHNVEIMVSGVMPFYTMDIYSAKFDKKEQTWEKALYRPRTDHDKKVMKAVRGVLREFGFRPIRMNLLCRSVPRARTDLNEKSVSVLDCLFSDCWGYTNVKTRQTAYPRQDVVPGVEHVTWDEEYDKKGRLVATTVKRLFKSFDVEKTVIDANGEILEVSVRDREYNEFAMDVAKRRKNLKSKKRKK